MRISIKNMWRNIFFTPYRQIFKKRENYEWFKEISIRLFKEGKAPGWKDLSFDDKNMIIIVWA